MSKVDAPLDTYSIKVNGKILAVQLSSSGRMLMAATELNVLFFDLETKKKIGQADISKIKTPVIATENFATIIHAANFYDVSSQKTITNFTHALQSGSSLTPSEQILVTSGFHDSRITTWDRLTEKMLNNYVYDGWFSKKNFTGIYAYGENIVLAATNSGSVDFINTDRGDVIKSLDIGSEPADIASIIDHRFTIIRSGLTLSVIDLAKNMSLMKIKSDRRATSAYYNSGKHILFLATEQGNLFLYEERNPKAVVNSYAINGQSDIFIVSSKSDENLIVVSNGGKLMVFSVTD